MRIVSRPGKACSKPRICVIILTPAPTQPRLRASVRASLGAASALTAPVRMALITWASIMAIGILWASSNRVMVPVARGTPWVRFPGIAPRALTPNTVPTGVATAAGSTFTTPAWASCCLCASRSDVLAGCSAWPARQAAKASCTAWVANAISLPPASSTSCRLSHNTWPGARLWVGDDCGDAAPEPWLRTRALLGW